MQSSAEEIYGSFVVIQGSFGGNPAEKMEALPCHTHPTT